MSKVITAPTWLWMIASRPAPIAPHRAAPASPSEAEQQDVAAGEHDRDATPGEDPVPDRPAFVGSLSQDERDLGMTEVSQRRRVTAVLFDRFELLDVFGPLELFGALSDHFEIGLVGPVAGPVRSSQGPSVFAETTYAEAEVPDVVLVPGGIGTRALVQDSSFRSWLAGWALQAEIVASVCTGSAVLASAGLLDGYRATSNKRAFGWAKQQGPHVDWVAKARWVEDRDRWTSSGVAAGMDMTLALIASMHSEELASALADRVELEWHRDPGWDPFAFVNG
ncbi:MAG TPA: DJ-1/PfpI family protein, partial [Acidimicrobiales bacterium]|nr:DJ-1/PfpI family protein [Acidimicrobiales bacterium]